MGAWIEILPPMLFHNHSMVAPLVGAWIEISRTASTSFLIASLPSWERGLKSLDQNYTVFLLNVAPLVGAWIDISKILYLFLSKCVAPLVGAWIEIGVKL